jgi:hypothetical protein
MSPYNLIYYILYIIILYYIIYYIIYYTLYTLWAQGELYLYLTVYILWNTVTSKPEGTTSLESYIWNDNIKMDVEEMRWETRDWVHLAQDNDKWRALMVTLKNFWVPLKGRIWEAQWILRCQDRVCSMELVSLQLRRNVEKMSSLSFLEFTSPLLKFWGFSMDWNKRKQTHSHGKATLLTVSPNLL